MASTRNDAGCLFPELRLRPFNDGDRDLVDEDDNEPDAVLSLSRGDGSPTARFAFWMNSDEIAVYRRDQLKHLTDPRFTQAAFGEREGHDPGGDLRDVMAVGHRFLAQALRVDGLTHFTRALSELQDGSVLRVDYELGGAGPLWGLLHPTRVPTGGVADPSGLLGYRFALVWPLNGRDEALTAEQKRNAPLNVFREEPHKRYGFIDDHTLPSVQRRTERTFLAERTGTDFDPLHLVPLRPDGSEDSSETLKNTEKLVEYLTLRARTATHFACHGVAEEDRRYALKVRRGTLVLASKLRRGLQQSGAETLDAASGAGSRFLFLNLCSSAADHTRSGQDAEAALSGLRPEALVGTIGAVCDHMAEQVAVRFYEKALRPDRTVAEAYLGAIRDRLAETLNPAHLLFVLKGGPNVVIA